MRRILYFLIIISCLSGLIFSCSKENYCASDVVAYLKIGFYTWTDGEIESYTISKFTARGISSDSLIYNNASKKTIELPLSNISDTSRFVFTYRFDFMQIDTTWIVYNTLSITDSLPVLDTIIIDDIDTTKTTKYLVDTLDVIYSRQMYLISSLCGFGYDYEITEAHSTHNYIDSIRLENPYVTIVDTEDENNIDILY